MIQNIKFITLLFATCTFTACEFNQSFNKDFKTGASSRGDGIGVDAVGIEINGKMENRNKFTELEKVNFIFNDITGLTKENGRVFPGLSMYIVDNNSDTLKAYPDLLGDLQGGTDLSPLQLQAHFIAGTDDVEKRRDDKFKVLVTIWDKKGDGTFRYELPFTVAPNELLDIKSDGLEYSSIYLWDETNQIAVVNEEVKFETTYMLLLEGLDGLEVLDEKVYPAFSIHITDDSGHKILSSANILEDYRKYGIDQAVFKENQLPVTITFTPGEIANPCRLEAVLTDLNSERRIEIDAELVIE